MFAGASRLVHLEQFISAELIYAFVRCILLSIASSVGHAGEGSKSLAATTSRCERSRADCSQHVPSFAALPRVPHQLQALLTGCQPEPPCPLPAPNCDWFTLPEDALLAAPRLLNHTMSSLHTIYNEMRLPPDARAGSKAVAAPTVHPVTSVQTARELVLSKTLKQHRHKAALSLSVSDLKSHMSSR